MSSVIAVSVSLLGLSLALFTLVIFIQMILSFPAMLSSNSQAYVQQHRKLHHIHRARPDPCYYQVYEGDEQAAAAADDDDDDDDDIEEEQFTRGRTLRRQASRLDGALGCRQRQVNRL